MIAKAAHIHETILAHLIKRLSENMQTLEFKAHYHIRRTTPQVSCEVQTQIEL